MDSAELLNAKVVAYEKHFRNIEATLAYALSRLQASELQIVHVDLKEGSSPPEVDFIVDVRDTTRKDGFVLFYETVYDNSIKQLENLHAKMVQTDA